MMARSLCGSLRAGLPQGKQIEVLATRRMKLWANGLDPDFPHSERVASWLFNSTTAFSPGMAAFRRLRRCPLSLLAAALLHDVGKSEGQKGHHKTSFDLIRAHGNPLAGSPRTCSAPPWLPAFTADLAHSKAQTVARFFPDEQKQPSNSLRSFAWPMPWMPPRRHIRRIHIENVQIKGKQNEALEIAAEGIRPWDHLLKPSRRAPFAGDRASTARW